jgi:exopolyphosphatase/guanosine-5'-triphosphate,3'-diphosphate pyrophosphatase
VIAAIDCGSNSIRLLVADDQGVRARDLSVTRLAEGVDATGMFTDAAIARTVDAVAAFVRTARSMDASPIRIVATSAVRDARDRDRFLDAVEERTGLRPDVLSGEEEARLSFLGATDDQRRDGMVGLVDIGGGSTEIVVGRDRVPERWVSTQIGCVRHTERYGLHGIVAEDALRALDHDLDAGFARALDGWPPVTRLVGVAGTVTTLAAIDLGLRSYDPDRVHGHHLDLDRIEGLRAELAAIDPGDRLARYPVISPGREDVLVAGASILLAVARAVQVSEVVASELEILHGIVVDLRDR